MCLSVALAHRDATFTQVAETADLVEADLRADAAALADVDTSAVHQ